MTLTTDFGTRDPYVAAMKGMILRACPKARIVDLCHEVPAHDIVAGAFLLAQAAPCFPEGTLHVAVVDPTVGTGRRILAADFGDQTYLFPDNGVITFIASAWPLKAMHAVRNPRYLPADPSMTFHGRDIFAPVAGHILNGVNLSALGPQPDRHVLLDMPAPRLEGDAIVGQVIYVDRFGNLVSNISRAALEARWRDLDGLTVRCAGRELGILLGTYAFTPPGEALALINSAGLVEVAVNRGRAADVLAAGFGAEVSVHGP